MVSNHTESISWNYMCSKPCSYIVDNRGWYHSSHTYLANLKTMKFNSFCKQILCNFLILEWENKKNHQRIEFKMWFTVVNGTLWWKTSTGLLKTFEENVILRNRSKLFVPFGTFSKFQTWENWHCKHRSVTDILVLLLSSDIRNGFSTRFQFSQILISNFSKNLTCMKFPFVTSSQLKLNMNSHSESQLWLNECWCQINKFNFSILRIHFNNYCWKSRTWEHRSVFSLWFNRKRNSNNLLNIIK